jgi:hypothetical protein
VSSPKNAETDLLSSGLQSGFDFVPRLEKAGNAVKAENPQNADPNENLHFKRTKK